MKADRENIISEMISLYESFKGLSELQQKGRATIQRLNFQSLESILKAIESRDNKEELDQLKEEIRQLKKDFALGA